MVSAKRDLTLRDDEVKHLRSQIKSTETSQQPPESATDSEMKNTPRQSTPSKLDSITVEDQQSSDQIPVENISSVEDQVSLIVPDNTMVEESEKMTDVSL